MVLEKNKFLLFILTVIYFPFLCYGIDSKNGHYQSAKNIFEVESPFPECHTTVSKSQGVGGEGMIFLYDNCVIFGSYAASLRYFEDLNKTSSEEIQEFYQWIISRYQQNLNLKDVSVFSEKIFDYNGSTGYQVLYRASYPGEQIEFFSKRKVYRPVVVVTTFYPYENMVVFFDLIVFSDSGIVPWEQYNKFCSSFSFINPQ